MDEIKFYHTGEEYGCVPNFSAHPITVVGKRWPTSEHYFQAQKFAGTHHEDAVRRAASPLIAAWMGRDRSRPPRKDWECVKDSFMLEAVRAKFRQHDDIGPCAPHARSVTRTLGGYQFRRTLLWRNRLAEHHLKIQEAMWLN
jgi:predicted NAD-dependent protein-ADP-ribosyltransferase YbiA (DUF1768 family)